MNERRGGGLPGGDSHNEPAAPTTRRVVVLARATATVDDLDRWIGWAGGTHVEVFSPEPRDEWGSHPHAGVRPWTTGTVTEVHETLCRLNPPDGIIDDWDGDDEEVRERWQVLFFHLAAGSRYLLPRLVDDVASAPPTWVANLETELFEFAGDETLPFNSDGLRFDDLASLGAIEYTSAGIGLIKRHDHLLKLRDHTADELIRVRERCIEVRQLAAQPSGSFVARGSVVHYEADVPIDWPAAVISYPELFSRHYVGEITYASHMLAYVQRSILPESYRWHLAVDPSNPATINSSNEFARVRPPDDLANERGDDPPLLDGDYYQIESGHPGFGHVMTEVIGRLWGWDEAKEMVPDLKMLCYAYRSPFRIRRTPKFKILRAYGVSANDIVWTDRPVRVRSLVGTTNMWHNHEPYSVHPGLRDTWDRIGARLRDRNIPRFDRIFVGRGPRFRRRACRNADRVEQTFADHGFEIVYPEDWTMRQQATLFRRARVIAGLGGSGLFNVAFARNLESMIILNQDSYHHRNEHLFTALLGPATHYFWSTADTPQDNTGQARLPAESGWEFDFARHGAHLRTLLRSV